MPSLNRNEKVQCGDCGNLYVRAHAVRHRNIFSNGVISCPECRYFTYNQQEVNYHVAKKHAPSISKQSMVRSSCEKEFPCYFSLQQHRRIEHGATQRKPSDTVADLDKIVKQEGEYGEKLKEELSACRHFPVDSEIVMGDIKYLTFK